MNLEILYGDTIEESKLSKFIATVGMLSSLGYGIPKIADMLHTHQANVERVITMGSNSRAQELIQRGRVPEVEVDNTVERAPNYSEFIENWEGRRDAVYTDTAGNPTIGVGFNLNRSDARTAIEAIGANYDSVVNGTQRLNDTQIDRLLSDDVRGAVNYAHVTVAGFSNLPTDVREIIVDMIFNLGRRGFDRFVNFKDAIAARNWAGAADALVDSRWYNQVGRRSRHHEAVLRSIN